MTDIEKLDNFLSSDEAPDRDARDAVLAGGLQAILAELEEAVRDAGG